MPSRSPVSPTRARISELRLIVLIVGALTTLSCNSGASPTSSEPRVQYDFGRLTTLIESTLDTLDFAESAALILVQHGHVIYEKEFGSLTVDTPIPIASSAKWLTAATILAVIDNGALELDGRMDEYLPPNFYRGPGGMGKEEITVRQLLALTSGLPTTHPCIYQDSKTLEACMLDIGARAQVAPAGSAFVYGQAAFTVAGAAAELETGRTWPEIFADEIARPLEFRDTHFLGGQNPQLGDGAISTVRDYVEFLRMILAGGDYKGRRVLSNDLVREMLRDQTAGAQVVFSPRGPSVHYGLGVWRDRSGTGGDALAVSSPGSLGFVPWIDFERELIGVLAIPPHLERTGELANQVLELINEIVPPNS